MLTLFSKDFAGFWKDFRVCYLPRMKSRQAFWRLILYFRPKFKHPGEWLERRASSASFRAHRRNTNSSLTSSTGYYIFRHFNHEWRNAKVDVCFDTRVNFFPSTAGRKRRVVKRSERQVASASLAANATWPVWSLCMSVTARDLERQPAYLKFVTQYICAMRGNLGANKFRGETNTTRQAVIATRREQISFSPGGLPGGVSFTLNLGA